MPLAGSEWEPRAYLDSLILHGVKLGLQNINSLMDASGRPHLAYPVVHVGGTNGKGSVTAFLAAMLQAAGYRVGRFTSPHLLDVTERFLLNHKPMSEEDLCENLSWFRQVSASTGCVPTFFEMNTAVAFRWFARKAVDIALVEVGMGGRFDSTNIVQPLACAITNIDLDHTQFLGDTVAQIAFEKAGILKEDVPAVIGVESSEALEVICEQARQRSAPLYCRDSAYTFQTGGTVWQPEIQYHGLGAALGNLSLGLAGRHQAHNAAVALSLALLIRDRFPGLSEAAIRQGLQQARWPGRLERVLDDPPVIMDVAHNPAGCAALVSGIERCVVLFSVSSDKDAGAMLDILSTVADPLILTEYRGGRSLSLERLQHMRGGKPCLAYSDLPGALAAGMQLASQEKPLLITGSIYAAGEARSILIERYGARPVTFG